MFKIYMFLLKNFKRQALHAYHIGFTHPFTKKYLEFESEFPQDLKNLLDLLLKYSLRNIMHGLLKILYCN